LSDELGQVLADQIDPHAAEIDHHPELAEQVLPDDPHGVILLGIVRRDRPERSGPSVDADLHVFEFLSMLFRAAETLQERAMHRRRVELDRQRRDARSIEVGDLRSGVEDEEEPSASVDRSADVRPEAEEKEILIGSRDPVSG